MGWTTGIQFPVGLNFFLWDLPGLDGRGVGVRGPVGAINVSLLSVQTPWVPPASYPVDTGVRAAGA
jgi:hypothetical protein